jgi:hypothetical protein
MSKSSTQKSKPVRKIEKARLDAKIINYIENGRKEITSKKQLEKYAFGSLISYMTKSDIFKPGGYITKFGDDNFIYITPDLQTKYRVRYENVKKMWVGDVYKVRNDLVTLAKTKQEPTRYKVIFNDVIIFYATSSFDAKRYQCTEKYKRLVAWNEYFNGKK